MSYESELKLASYVAGADLSTHQYKFVKLNSSGQVILCSAAGEHAIGVLQNKPISGVAASVAVQGVCKVLSSGVVTAGDRVATDASGLAKTAVAGKTDTSDAGAAADALIGSNVIGRAQITAAANDIFAIRLTFEGVVATTAA